MGTIVISKYKYYDYYKNKLTNEQIEQYKNKLVLFESDWNDYNFFSTFYIVYFNDNGDDIMGYIKIFNEKMEISEDKYESRNAKKFLLDIEKKENDSYYEIYLSENSNKEIYSIGNIALYNKLLQKFDSGTVNSFLKSLREISTIEDNNEIKRIESKGWYKKSFIREKQNEKLVEFTKLKNDISINANTYRVMKNMSEYTDNFDGKIINLLEWAEKYDLSINEAKDLFCVIKNSNINIENIKKFLGRFKEKYLEYTDFIKEIDNFLEINKEFYTIVKEIQDILKVKEDELKELKIGHYTSLKTVRNLVKYEKDKTQLRLTNGRQMNDPLEGKVLLDYVIGGNTKNNQWLPTFWYVSSITSEIDSLPMWKQYGKDATGAVLVYDSDYLIEILDLCNVEIYKVAYIKIDETNNIKISNTKNLSKKDREKLEKSIIKLKDMETSNINIPTLSNIEFLFKKTDYSYENEYRIIINMEDNNNLDIKAADTDDYELPFLYVYLKNAQPRYSELIVGPKSIDIDYIAPYIHYCDNDIKIRKSSIAFR